MILWNAAVMAEVTKAYFLLWCASNEDDGTGLVGAEPAVLSWGRCNIWSATAVPSTEEYEKVTSTVMTAGIWGNRVEGQDDAEDEDIYLRNSGAEGS